MLARSNWRMGWLVAGILGAALFAVPSKAQAQVAISVGGPRAGFTFYSGRAYPYYYGGPMIYQPYAYDYFYAPPRWGFYYRDFDRYPHWRDYRRYDAWRHRGHRWCD